MKILFLVVLITIFSQPLIAQVQSEEELAEIYYRNGEWEKALPFYQQLFTTGDKEHYYDAYLNTLLQLKKYDEAEKLVAGMMNTRNAPLFYRVDYGRILQEKGDREKAENWYKGLIKDLPADESSIRDLAIAFYRVSAYDFSVQTLLAGRKRLKAPDLFSFDLLSLYRFQKNKEMLVQEYLHLLSADQSAPLVTNAKAAFSSVLTTPEDYAVLQSALEKRRQKAPANTAFADLLIWTYLQQKKYALALKESLIADKEFDENGERVYDLTSLLLDNNEYKEAVEGLNYIIGRGKSNPYYIAARTQVLKCRFQILTSGSHTATDLGRLRQDYYSVLQELGKGIQTVFAMRQLAQLEASYLGTPSKAEILLEEILKIPGLPAMVKGQTKLELGDIYLMAGERWEAALMYEQTAREHANEEVGQEAKFRSARLSYFQGEFVWAQAQLDVLKSSTSQLIANDALNLSLLIAENTASKTDTNALLKYAYADQLAFCNHPQQALSVLDSIDRLFPGNSLSDDIFMAQSRIFLKLDSVTRAITCLTSVVEKFGYDIWADDAAFMLAEIYETRLRDRQKAEAYYEKIITDYPGSFYITEARKRFRNLRGDKLG